MDAKDYMPTRSCGMPAVRQYQWGVKRLVLLGDDTVAKAGEVLAGQVSTCF